MKKATLIFLLLFFFFKSDAQTEIRKIVNSFLIDDDKTFLFHKKKDNRGGILLQFNSISTALSTSCWIILPQKILRDTIYVYWQPTLDCKHSFAVNRIFKGIKNPRKGDLLAIIINPRGTLFKFHYMFPDWVAKYNNVALNSGQSETEIFPSAIKLHQ